MRWIAAVDVAIYHASDLFGFLLPRAYLAVDLFFVLSGVVVANAYERGLLGTTRLRRFARIRFARLYPLYLLGFALGVLALAIAPNGSVAETGPWAAIAAGMLMIPSFAGMMVAGDGNAALYPLDHPAWSLFFELAVNLVYAWLVRYLSNRRIAVILVLSGVLLIVTGADKHTLDLGWRPRQLPFGVLRTCYSFFGGVLIHRTAPQTARLTARLPRWPAAIAILLLVSAALGFSGQGLAGFYDLACVLVLFPLLVCCALPLFFPRWVTRIFAAAGTLSYALYVLHWPCHEIADAIGRDGYSLGQPWNGLVFLLLLLGFCQIADLLYDRPLRRLLGGVSRHRPAV
jgi:peptidoglycan/LPS O-acetylase OafA/YrhL